MLIIKSGTKIDKSNVNKLFIFDDLMHESEIVARLEELAKELNLFNPEVQITIATNRNFVISFLRVLALESGNLDQFRIEYSNLDGTSSVQTLDESGDLTFSSDDFREENTKLIMRVLSYANDH